MNEKTHSIQFGSYELINSVIDRFMRNAMIKKIRMYERIEVTDDGGTESVVEVDIETTCGK